MGEWPNVKVTRYGDVRVRETGKLLGFVQRVPHHESRWEAVLQGGECPSRFYRDSRRFAVMDVLRALYGPDGQRGWCERGGDRP